MAQLPWLIPLLGLVACSPTDDPEADPPGNEAVQPSPAPEVHSRSRPWWFGTQVPEGELRQLGLGVEHACALDPDGAVRCWGHSADGRTEPPPGRWAASSVGGEHACALDEDGHASCWGRDTDGSTQPPEGRFGQISAGFGHSCGLRLDGSAACWGWNADGQASPPAGRFVSIHAGYHHSCAIDPSGSPHCWGRDLPGSEPSGLPRLRSLALGQAHTCGLSEQGSVHCWGEEGRPEGRPATMDADGLPRSPPHQQGWVGGLLTAPPGRYTALGAGVQHSCALHESGRVLCWGHDAAFQARPPGLVFQDMAVGFYSGCGLTAQGQPSCWGWKGRADRAGQAPPQWSPEGQLVDRQAELPITCPYEGLGLLYLSQGRHEDAKAMLTTAVDLVPHLEHGKYNGLARIHMESGDSEAARAMLERSVTITPDASNEAWRLLEQLDSSTTP